MGGLALAVSNSTLSGNRTSNGGGIDNSGTLTVSNSTLSGNEVGNEGGGIRNSGTLRVSNSTLSRNEAANVGGGDAGAGGILNRGGTATLKNTIVANNPRGGDCLGFGGNTDGGYNLDSDDSCGFTEENNSLSGVDPLLGPLANNGGPTQTHALLEGSPAIDQGNSFGATTDQRGLERPSDFATIDNATGGDGSDIGAFEVQAPPNRPPVADNDSFTTDEDATLQVTAADGVLKNDTDPDGDPLSAAVLSSPAHGTLTLNNNGSFSYTPAPNFNGTDSFTYKACDDEASELCDTAKVTITVRPVAEPPQPDPTPECTIKGTPGKDALRGTNRRDVICAYGGNDSIQGMGGNDLIMGGAGRDSIQGNAGDDTIYGGDGRDTIQGNEGDDTIYGGSANDTMQGNDGRDKLYGGAGDDTMQGGAGNDLLNGGSGKDVTQQQ